MPRISVITALYNHEKYVAQAIESCLNQTFQDFEHILWDDGSKDRSLDIAREYEKTYPDKIRVYTHPGRRNFGQETTRNEALKVARGELLCLLDSDDYFHPRKLEALLPPFSNPAVGLVYGKSEILVEKTGEIFPASISCNPTGKVLDALVEENFLCGDAVLFRRECIADGFAFDSAYRTMGEYPLWIKIARDWELAFVPEAVSVWRDHGLNQSTKLALEARAELVSMCKRLKADPAYADHSAAISRALARKQYDYASELYAAAFGSKHAKAINDALKTIRSLCWQAMREPEATKPIRAKSALLLGVSFLGTAPNRNLSRIKRRVWELRHPVAAAAQNSGKP